MIRPPFLVWAVLASGEPQTSATDGMVRIPEGCHKFTCEGSPKGCDSASRAQIKCLKAYWIDRSEVTNRAYRACVLHGDCRAPKACGPGFTYEMPGHENDPVSCVSQNEALYYCVRQKKRLPSPAEWERAGQGKAVRRYPWGNGAPTCGRVAQGILIEGKKRVHCTLKPAHSTAVCSHPEGNSPEGLCDMAGGVAEWTAVSSATKGSLVKGGSPLGAEHDFLSLSSQVYVRSRVNPSIGFRCVRDDAGTHSDEPKHR